MFAQRKPESGARIWWERSGTLCETNATNIFQALFEARYYGASQADGYNANGDRVSFVLRDGVWRRRVDP
jgi:hypothetical protein